MPEPDYMHGTLDVWPVLEGALVICPHVAGDTSCQLYVGTTAGDIGIWTYVIGDICVDTHLCGEIEVNP